MWKDKSVDGLKTGHTEAAGYCLVASALRDNTRLISVVLGTKSDKARTQQSQALLNYGFRYFESHLLYKAHETLKQVPIWFGTQDQIAVGLNEDLHITIAKGRYKDLNAQIEIQGDIEAPIQKGEQLGNVIVKLDDNILTKKPLVALQSIDDAGIVKRAIDSIKKAFQ